MQLIQINITKPIIPFHQVL